METDLDLCSRRTSGWGYRRTFARRRAYGRGCRRTSLADGLKLADGETDGDLDGLLDVTALETSTDFLTETLTETLTGSSTGFCSETYWETGKGDRDGLRDGLLLGDWVGFCWEIEKGIYSGFSMETLTGFGRRPRRLLLGDLDADGDREADGLIEGDKDGLIDGERDGLAVLSRIV